MKKFHGWIDRIEGEAVIVGIYDSDETFSLPRSIIPFVREGDVIAFELKENSLTIKKDEEEKQRRLQRIRERRKRLLGEA